MEILEFVITVILITASGALAPGPLFFANISKGVKLGAKGGFMFSVAHTLVEFTLVMLLAFQLLIIASEVIEIVVGIVGGIVLVGFGAIQIYGSIKPRTTTLHNDDKTGSYRLLGLGLAFTGLNPFFLIWWLTAGAQLIIISLEFASLAGVFLMYICHVWMDYVWLTATAYFAKLGMNVAGLKWYRILMAVFSVILIYFGLVFLTSAIHS
ncbi:MAG: LysE family transporter [Candidatus Bathyarchaeota archaeon]|nr:MAG: LysE family transporter [Candidatus Bathyarchaeota archaeon]